MMSSFKSRAVEDPVLETEPERPITLSVLELLAECAVTEVPVCTWTGAQAGA